MSRHEDRVTAPQTAFAGNGPSPRDADLRRLEQQGYVVMSPFLALHGATQGKAMAIAVKGAQLFLITFAFVTPVLLLIAYG
jgi:hypothetical protein